MITDPSALPAHLRQILTGKPSRLLVAVSGGIDSMTLLHLCSELRSELGLSLAVAHVDHGLRPGSADDAMFVASRAAALGLPLATKCLTPPGKGTNVEAWGRSARYAFFREVMHRDGYDLTLTAHTADDAVETLLMRLMANREPRPILSEDPERALLRPLLGIGRSALHAFARETGIEWREDETNKNPAFLRNRVRHELLPRLTEQFGEGTIENLYQRALAFADDYYYFDREAGRRLAALESLSWGSKEWVRELRAALAEAPEELRWRLCERAIKPVAGFNIGRRHARLVLGFMLGNAARLELPGRLTLRRREGGLTAELTVTMDA